MESHPCWGNRWEAIKLGLKIRIQFVEEVKTKLIPNICVGMSLMKECEWHSRKVKQHVRRPGDKRAGSILVRASLVAQMVKRLPWMQETWVWSMGWEDPLEKRMATHSSILSWRIPWTEEPGGLQSMELQRFWHDWATNRHKHISRIQRNPVWQAWWGVGITYLSESPFYFFEHIKFMNIR